MNRTYAVYILASRQNGTLYIGSTNDLVRRIYEHRMGSVPGFTRTYAVKHLVYFEFFDWLAAAIQREKRLKKWKRLWKIGLIEKDNPSWNALYEGIAF